MIVVTAPTSKIAGQLLPHLLAQNEPVRVIARDASRLPTAIRDRVEVIEGSHSDIGPVDRAFAGADSVFWLVPPQPHTHSVKAAYLDFTRPASTALRNNGVQRVVAVSVLGRGTAWERQAGLATAAIETCDLIGSSGVHLRALALPGFMDNMLQQAGELKAEGTLSYPLPGDMAYPTCSTGDIAAAAARLLLDPTWTGVSDVPVLGPEDLSYDNTAEILSDVLGKAISYQRVPLDEYRAQLLGYGLSKAFVDGLVEMFEAKAKGLDNGAIRTEAYSTPTTLRDWATQFLKPVVNG